MLQVSWFDPNNRALTSNEDVVTSDPRFELDRPYYKEWNLIINGVQAQDEGTYNCKVYTNPVANNLVNLLILRKLGPSQWRERHFLNVFSFLKRSLTDQV